MNDSPKDIENNEDLGDNQTKEAGENAFKKTYPSTLKEGSSIRDDSTQNTSEQPYITPVKTATEPNKFSKFKRQLRQTYLEVKQQVAATTSDNNYDEYQIDLQIAHTLFEQIDNYHKVAAFLAHSDTSYHWKDTLDQYEYLEKITKYANQILEQVYKSQVKISQKNPHNSQFSRKQDDLDLELE